MSAAQGIKHAMRMRCIICGLRDSYSIFPLYLANGTIFGEKLLNTKCVFWFYLQLLSETFLILGRTERDMIKKTVCWTSHKVPVILARFWQYLNSSRQIFAKYSNTKFHENPSSGSRVVPFGRTDKWTDRRAKANSRISQTCLKSEWG